MLRSGGYAIDFWGLGYEIAERMGLKGDIDRIGYHIRELRIVDDRGERIAGFGTKVFRELTGGRFVTLGRSDLSLLLFEKIKGTTEVIFGDEIVSLEEHTDSVRVQLEKAGMRRHLRSKRTIRRSRPAAPNGDRRGQIKDIVSIRERPAAVEDRAVPGHWEGDLLTGSKNSYIATLVERHTRYVTLAKVANKDTQTVVSALIKQAKKLPNELYKSLTWDRGKELADHRRFTLATNIDVYFCDPQSPWQRGSNENTNGLLRQYFPKGTDLSVYSQAHLNRVARQLNERPRETLGFETPADRFNACVASTG